MRRINTCVYETAAAAGVKSPDLAVFLAEQYGQCAEDLIVLSMLRAWQRRTGRDPAASRYLEIGANHPIGTSATYLLHRALGMRGVLVEANPALIDDLRRVRPDDVVVHAAVQATDAPTAMLSLAYASEISSLDPAFVAGWEGGVVDARRSVEVPAMRIGPLIETCLDGQAPLFLSIDIEGLDLEVLLDLDLDRFRPVLLQIEPSDQREPGRSDRMRARLSQAGYLLAAATDVNLIFMDRDAMMDADPLVDPPLVDPVRPRSA